MRIGELASEAGVTVRALRYYEEQTLITSVRSGGGQRQFPAAAVDRVRLIQLLYRAGLSSKTILTLLPCVDAGVSTPESREILARERNRVAGQITELIEVRDRLDAVISMTQDRAICTLAS
jgi:DNA-binding transcriptional MerR regulator